MKQFFSRKKAASAAAILLLSAATISTVVFATGGGGGGSGGGGGGGGMGGPGGAGNMGAVEMSESVITVNLQTPTTGDLSRSTDFIGKIESGESSSVYPETSGKVQAVHAAEGDTVRAGDLLLTLDDSDAQLTYQIAQTSYEKTSINVETTLGSNYTSSLLSAESSLKSAQQSLSTARLNLSDYNDGTSDELVSAQKTLDRIKVEMDTLEKELNGMTSDDEGYATTKAKLEESEAEYALARTELTDLENDSDPELRDLRLKYSSARTSYESALEKYNLVKGDSLEDTKASAGIDLKSAELSLEKSANELNKYKVYAPIGGVIETKDVDISETVNQNTAVFTISNQNSISVKFNASADAATALSTGDAVTLTKSGTSYTALITSIDSRADDSTGLFPIEAQVQNDDGSLLPGVAVKVSAATQKSENALLIPIDLVYYDEGQAYVFTYSDGKAHRADIVTGMSSSETVAVESGLTASSELITTWHPDLKDGVAVTLAEGTTTSGASTADAKSSDATASGAATDAKTPDATASETDAKIPDATASETSTDAKTPDVKPSDATASGAASETPASDEKTLETKTAGTTAADAQASEAATSKATASEAAKPEAKTPATTASETTVSDADGPKLKSRLASSAEKAVESDSKAASAAQEE